MPAWKRISPACQEMEALQDYIEEHFEGFNEGPLEPAVDPASLAQGLHKLHKAVRYARFLRDHEIRDVRSLCQSLREDMPDASSFDAALLQMPPKLVCMLVLFARMQEYELAHAVVNEILLQAKSEPGRTEVLSKTLRKMLSEMFPDWYERRENTLNYVLEVAIEKLEGCVSRNWCVYEWCETPHTFEEAFYNCVWPGLELFYTGQAFSGQQLNRIMIVAAQNGFMAVLRESIRLGAEFHRIVEVPVVRFQNGVVLKTSEKPRGHSALHHLFYHHDGLDLEQLPWPEAGCKDVVSFRHSSGDTLLHSAVTGLSAEALKNVQFLMKHGADVNVRGEGDQTVLQRLLSKKWWWQRDDRMDMLLHLVEKAATIEPRSWKTEVPVLHVLCELGQHEHILLLVAKGADKRALTEESNTLIDTLVLSKGLTFDQKEKTMAALLDGPLCLGPFHSDQVAKRIARFHRGCTEHILPNRFCNACSPLCPVVNLLLPALYTKRALQSNLRMIKLMVNGGAVSNRELLSLEPCLAEAAQINNQEAVDYLTPLIQAGREAQLLSIIPSLTR